MERSVNDILDWKIRSACNADTAALFYPPSHAERRDEKMQRENAAKAICAICEVRAECLDYALRIGDEHGIYGGYTPEERR